MFYLFCLFKIHFDGKFFPTFPFVFVKWAFLGLLRGGFDHDSWMLNCANADAGLVMNFSRSFFFLFSSRIKIPLGGHIERNFEWDHLPTNVNSSAGIRPWTAKISRKTFEMFGLIFDATRVPGSSFKTLLLGPVCWIFYVARKSRRNLIIKKLVRCSESSLWFQH